MKRGAFSLIELIVVIAIIGLLAAASVVGLSQQQAAARDGRRASDMRTGSDAIEAYITSTGNLPTQDNDAGGWDLSSVGDFMASLRTGGYLNHAITDPINTLKDNLHNSPTGFVYEFAIISNTTSSYTVTPQRPFYVLEARAERSTAAVNQLPAGVACPTCSSTFNSTIIRYIGW